MGRENKSVILTTPKKGYRWQRDKISCGPYALSTVLDYFNIPHPENLSELGLRDSDSEPILPERISSALEHYGLYSQVHVLGRKSHRQRCNFLREQIEEGNPVIIIGSLILNPVESILERIRKYPLSALARVRPHHMCVFGYENTNGDSSPTHFGIYDPWIEPGKQGLVFMNHRRFMNMWRGPLIWRAIPQRRNRICTAITASRQEN